jgi:hypothetical protein
MNGITENTVLARNSEILANEIGHETVMMSIKEGKYFGMNKTGSYIWKVLEKPLTFAELCSKLVKDFNISKEECVNDVQPFIEEMTKEKIILIQ